MNKINELPDEIIRYIIPFTYQLQNKELLDEIRKHFLKPKYASRMTMEKGVICYSFGNLTWY
jgi:hypothetical protein